MFERLFLTVVATINILVMILSIVEYNFLQVILSLLVLFIIKDFIENKA